MNNFDMYRKSQKLQRLSSLIVLLWSVTFNCHAAPLINSRSLWYNYDDISTIFSSFCNPLITDCVQWHPIVHSRLGDSDVEKDLEFDSAQLIQSRNANKVLDTWKKKAIGKIEVSNLENQLTVGKLIKKNVFMSRGWGAGGMPFSVLYMSPRLIHQPPSGTRKVGAGKNIGTIRKNDDLSSERINQSNYKVVVRNSGSGQPRRHYSIIPQLFISYGWGASGK